MKRFVSVLLCVCAVVALSAISASATVLTFEDMKAACDLNAPDYFAAIQNGYAGLNWSNFSAMDATLRYPGSSPGYVNGRVSGDVVLYNRWGEAATIMQAAAPLSLHSAYLTAAWNRGLNVTCDGYLGGALLFSKTVTIDCYQPTFVSYEFSGVDKLVWSSWGGTDAGFGGYGTHFAMDNLNIDPVNAPAVPEPSCIVLALIGGVSSMGGMIWRRKK